MLTSGDRQERNADGSPAKPHPAFKPHPMEAGSPDSSRPITTEAVDMKAIDRILTIAGPDADELVRRWRSRKAFCRHHCRSDLCGGSASVQASVPAPTWLCMLPDTGERYLSTPLFGDIGADMNERSWRSPLQRLTTVCRRSRPRASPRRCLGERFRMTSGDRPSASRCRCRDIHFAPAHDHRRVNDLSRCL